MVRFSLVAALAIGVSCSAIGCGKSSDYKPVGVVKKAAPLPDHDHGHGEKGPHGGGIIELGEEEYHGEIVVDHDSHAIVVYVLGKDGKTAEPVTATEITVTPEGKDALTLKAATQKDDPEGKVSKFELIDDGVVHALMDAGFIHGKLRITIADKQYLGDIDYHLSGTAHHDHDDDKTKPDEGAPK